ncbi:MAG: flagellar basal body L-ring protein FlgH [Polyangiales bacterium]
MSVSTHSLFVRLACLPLFACTLACGGSPDPRMQLDRSRDYKEGKYEQAPQAVSGGSLWQDSSRSLFADFRANHIGDLVTVVIDESAKASGDAGTEYTRDFEAGIGMPKFLGIMGAMQNFYPDLDPENLVRLLSDTSFDADGETERGSRMRANLSVRVKKQLPNGDLFVEGTKITQVNNEQLQIYISGVVRPQDINQDNEVLSSRVADAEIQFAGQGNLSDNQRKGWLVRMLGKMRPW